MNVFVFLLLVAFIGCLTGVLITLIEGRRGHQLKMKREEARIAEAQAKQQELEHRRAELQYREAVLEIERFDREQARRQTDR